ncbi:MAG: hypothetical protein RR400_01935 [Clostridia bacterium]
MSNKTNAVLNMKRFLSFMALMATVLIAISLVLQEAFSGSNFANIIRIVGEVIAYIFTCIGGFAFVRTKRNPVWAIIYAISVTVIVVFVILVQI